MRTRSYRGVLFIYGLIAGLLLGLVAGFMLRTFWNVPAPEFSITANDDRVEDEGQTSHRRVKDLPDATDYVEEADTLRSDSLMPSDELASADSLSPSYSGGNGDDIVVATDERIAVRVIEITGDSTSGKGGQNLDSLLINDKKNYPSARKLNVEFWKSPINYRGYRLQKDRLVVYGIEDYDVVSLRRSNGRLLMSVGPKTYILEENAEFRPLISVRPSSR